MINNKFIKPVFPIDPNFVANNLVLTPEGQKIVKTYEFHLPMHNIREESSKMEQYLAKPGQNNLPTTNNKQ